MKMYSVCDTPEDICVAPERLNSQPNYNCSYISSDVKITSIIQPSPTFALSECIPVTTTAYKTLSQLSECTVITATTTVFTEHSPNPHCKELSETKATNTEIITKSLTVSASTLCSCSKSAYDIKSQLNETASQILPSALGALLGIVAIALVLTIIGWVWTCWRVKKRGGIKINSDKQEQ